MLAPGRLSSQSKTEGICCCPVASYCRLQRSGPYCVGQVRTVSALGVTRTTGTINAIQPAKTVCLVHSDFIDVHIKLTRGMGSAQEFEAFTDRSHLPSFLGECCNSLAVKQRRIAGEPPTCTWTMSVPRKDVPAILRVSGRKGVMIQCLQDRGRPTFRHPDIHPG